MKTSIPPLFNHQKQSIKILKQQPRVFDTSDPGTGKTRVQIEDFATRRKKGGGKALIIAPKSLLRSAWANDFAKFAPTMKVSIAYAKNREQAFDVDADVYVTNTDAVVWLSKKTARFFAGFDTLIIDESTAFKHHTSQRSKAVGKIKKYFEYRRLLSGTPNSNGICDIWHQMLIVDDGQRLGRSFYAFRSAVCTPQQVGPMPNMVKWQDKPNAEAIVSALISDVVIRHKFEECVDIPPNHEYAIDFELSTKHKRAYYEMEKQSILMLKDQTVITAINGAVVHGKLLQIASGAVYANDGSHALIDSDRYELVMDLVEQRKQCVVFFNWAHQRDLIIKEAEARGITYRVIDGTTSSTVREMAVDHFQQGFFRMILAHPQSAGHGLTLTKGTTTIWASPTHNLEHYMQGMRRIYRIGQTEKTETIVIVAKDTIDVKTWEALKNKSVRMESLLSYLQEAA